MAPQNYAELAKQLTLPLLLSPDINGIQAEVPHCSFLDIFMLWQLWPKRNRTQVPTHRGLTCIVHRLKQVVAGRYVIFTV